MFSGLKVRIEVLSVVAATLVASVFGLVCATVSASAATPAWALADSFTIGGADGVGANGSGSLVLDPSSKVLYATSRFCGRFGPCDAKTYAISNGVQTRVDGACAALNPADHVMSCPDVAGKALVRYRAGTKLDTIPLGATPSESATDASDGTVWVTVDALSAAPKLFAVKNGVIMTRLALPRTAGLVAVDPGTHTVWVLAAEGDALMRIAGGKVAATTALPGFADKLEIDTATHEAYTLSSSTSELAITSSTAARRTLKLPGDAVDLAIDPARGEVLVPTYTTRRLHIVKNGAVADTIDLSTEYFVELVIDPATHVGYASALSGDAQKLVVSDAPSVRLARPSGFAVVQPEPLPAQPIPVAVFTQPMNRASVAAAFTLTASGGGDLYIPSVPGKLSWVSGDTVAIFTPDKPLPLGADFKATIGAGAKGADGRAILAAHSWEFRSRSASLLIGLPAADPYDLARVPVTAPLVAFYSDAMNRASVEANVKLYRGVAGQGAPVAGRFGWFGETVMIFVPDAPLAPGTRYTWTPGAFGIKEAGGGLAGGDDVAFTTAPTAATK